MSAADIVSLNTLRIIQSQTFIVGSLDIETSVVVQGTPRPLCLFCILFNVTALTAGNYFKWRIGCGSGCGLFSVLFRDMHRWAVCGDWVEVG
jgi:hypothetical protein